MNYSYKKEFRSLFFERWSAVVEILYSRKFISIRITVGRYFTPKSKHLSIEKKS